MRNLEHVKHVIIKIGSTSLCNEDGQLDKEKNFKTHPTNSYFKT